MDTQAIYIKGKFDADDWADLVRTLQNIESRHPSEDFQIFAADLGMSVAECMDLMNSVPPGPGVVRQYAVFRGRGQSAR